MSDKIKVSTDHLDEVTKYLNRLARDLRSASSSLDGIWMDSTTASHTVRSGACRLSGNAGVGSVTLGSTRGTIRRYSNALDAYDDLCSRLAKRVSQVKDRFIQLEAEISAVANDDADDIGDRLGFPKDRSLWTPAMWYGYLSQSLGSAGKSHGGGGSGDKGETFWNRLDRSFDFGNLARSGLSEFGPLGATFSAIWDFGNGFTTGKWGDAIKSGVKAAGSWFDFAGKTKWSNYKKLNRMGNNAGTKGFLKQLTKMYKTGKPAAKWTTRLTNGFKDSVLEPFVKVGKGGAKSANWAGIAGVVVDLGLSAYGNYKQVQNGEISGDRAVVETIAETGANVLLTAGGAALVAATLPVSAPTALVAAGGAAVVWAADSVTKLITGGDKGLGELASEGVGWAYDQSKKAVKGAVDAGKKAVQKTKKAVSNAFDNGKKFVKNLFS